MTAWTPANLSSLEIWIDPADAAQVVTDGSGYVTQLKDKSGHGRHFTQVNNYGGLYPKISAYNGQNAVYRATAQGGADLGYTGSTFLQDACTVAVFTRASNPGAPAGNSSSTPFVILGGGTFYPLGFDWTQPKYFYGGSAGPSWSYEAGLTNTATSAFVVVNKTSSTAVGFFRNGNTTAASSGNFSAAPTGYDTYWIGNDSNSAFMGYIGDVIVCSSSLSTADQQRLEGYLAWKWGETGLLPSGHPYKSAAPTYTAPTYLQTLLLSI